MPDEPTQFEDLLKDDGPVAIIVKQYLRPAEGEGEPVFPPTYPMPTYRGRVHTVRDGEYRVSVELPPYRREGQKNGKDESQDMPGYNIDQFNDGSNVCEIDSPQSQANRLEPLFKTIREGKLVPQINIKVGEETVNLLEAGHRAADAIVRLSSLVNEFHKAFNEVRKGNHLELARLAPTSILFGVWDSRGTQVKLPRIVKSEIRATNVETLTRSAQFVPAADFVGLGAVDEELDTGEGDKNPLGAEGMKHVPAPRGAGGVVVHGKIKRVVRINLVALREPQAFKDGKHDPEETTKLRRYLLGLALVAATQQLQLNLREGCLLCADPEEKGSTMTVNIDGTEENYKNQLDPVKVESFADDAAKSFFGGDYETKDYPDAVFEAGVANEFLAMDKADREKIARAGPITAEAIRRFKEKGKDPLKPVSEAIKAAKKNLPKKQGGKKAAPVAHPESLKFVSEQLDILARDEQIAEAVKSFSTELQKAIAEDKDTQATLKALEGQIKEFKQRTATEATTQSEDATSTTPA
jgi:CRISPR-associated protein Csb1